MFYRRRPIEKKGRKILHPLPRSSTISTHKPKVMFLYISALFVCLFYSSLPTLSVISSSRGSKPLTPRRYLGSGGKAGLGGSPKTARGEMGADRQRVCGVGERHGKKTNKPKKTPKTTDEIRNKRRR